MSVCEDLITASRCVSTHQDLSFVAVTEDLVLRLMAGVAWVIVLRLHHVCVYLPCVNYVPN